MLNKDSNDPIPFTSVMNPVDDPPLLSTFNDEIEALRAALHLLQDSFSNAASIHEKLQLASAINHITASLSRLIRAHQLIQAQQPSPLNHAISAALADVLQEWNSPKY
ncbi:MAG: hypothetical protein ACK2UE_09120 [Anaerolineales bacterium]|jgi:hypothetical protein